MKKSILFLGLLSIFISCSSDKEKSALELYSENQATDTQQDSEEKQNEEQDNFSYIDDTPKCNDIDVLNTVKILATPEMHWLRMYYYIETNKLVMYEGDEYYTDFWLKYYSVYGLNTERYLSEKRKKDVKVIQDLYKQGDTKTIEIFNKIVDTNIYAIRPMSYDEVTKKFDCEATISYYKSETKVEKNIYYSAQKTMDGMLHIDVY